MVKSNISTTQRGIMLPIIIVCLSFYSSFLRAQNYEKVWFDRSDSTYGYYTVVKPAGPRIQGAVILFDGYGGDASGLYAETKIHNVAHVNDLLTVSIPAGKRLFLDDAHMKIIQKILDEVAKTYDLRNDRFAVGGFSAGGIIALRYTELCYQHPEEFRIKPRAVFTVDSPVDILGRYESSKRILASHIQGWWLGEARMIIDTCDAKLGPLPQGLVNYRKVSPLLRSDSVPGNEIYLRTVAYRTYHDVDVEWWLKNRKQSIYESNMLDASELVNRLQLLGNTQAEFVASKTHGRRSNGQMHPHSWSIVDEIDLVYWIKGKLGFYPGDISRRYTYAAKDWQQEVIIFPIDFAPDIRYKGFEDLHFAPHWGDAGSPEKWAYTYVWYLDDLYHFNEKVLQQNLVSYYSGLTRRRAVADKDDMKNYFPATATVKKTGTVDGDIATYAASVHLYDAQVTKKPGDIYILAHLKACSDNNKTVLLFEVAGYPPGAPIWTTLDKINADFNCAGSR